MAIYNKQKQVTELLKCGRDVKYFLNKYARIQHPKRGLVPFDTYPFQDDCLEQFIKHRMNVVLKARQLGLSTITAGFVAWLALFHKHQNILVIATKRSTAQNFVKKVKVIIKNLPKWMMLAQIVGDNKEGIEFSHGSSIKAIPTSDDAGRSEGISLLIIDEAAWIRDFDELWTGLAPTISTGGKVIILSTPNGVGGEYHKIYTDAEQGLNNFNPIRLPWDVHPEHDEAWFEQETKGMTDRRKGQEYLCDFIASGETFLSLDDIDWVGQAIKPPIDKMGYDKSMWIWTHPVPGHKYLITADVARGDSYDFSAFHVIDMDCADIVAEYKGRIPPDEFGKFLAEVGHKYNKSLICPENNSFGYSTLCALRDVGYPRVYRKDSKAVYVVDYSPIAEDISQMGFNTNGVTRIRILSKMEEVVRNKMIKIHSSRLYDELKTFVWTGSKAQAQKGRNDDLVMSLAIGLWLYDVADGVNNRDTSIANALLAGMDVNTKTFSEIPGNGGEVGSKNQGVNKFVSQMVPIQLTDDDRIKKDPRFNHGDFSWLFR